MKHLNLTQHGQNLQRLCSKCTDQLTVHHVHAHTEPEHGWICLFNRIYSNKTSVSSTKSELFCIILLWAPVCSSQNSKNKTSSLQFITDLLIAATWYHGSAQTAKQPTLISHLPTARSLIIQASVETSLILLLLNHNRSGTTSAQFLNYSDQFKLKTELNPCRVLPSFGLYSVMAGIRFIMCDPDVFKN